MLHVANNAPCIYRYQSASGEKILVLPIAASCLWRLCFIPSITSWHTKRYCNLHLFISFLLTIYYASRIMQYLSHLSGVDSEVDPPQFSYLGHHLLNTNGIGHFRKQF